MAKCSYCEREAGPGRKICVQCLATWGQMRVAALDYLNYKFGALTKDSQNFFGAEMDRLKKLWKRRPETFRDEVEWGRIPDDITNRIAAALGNRYRAGVDVSTLPGIEHDRRRLLE